MLGFGPISSQPISSIESGAAPAQDPFKAQPTLSAPDLGARRPQSGYVSVGLLTTLLAVVAQAPVFTSLGDQPTPQHPSHRLSANANTSAGTPKPLYEDGVVAPRAYWGPGVQRRALLADTSRGFMPPAAAVQDPFINVQFSAAAFKRTLPDTSQGSWAALRGEVQPPFKVAQTFAPDRVRYVLPDTSKGTAKTLTADAAEAFFVPQVFAPDRVRPVTDTSKGSAVSLLSAVQDPFSVEPQPTPDRFRAINADASRGTPKVLYADSVKPFFVAPHSAPDRVRPVTDTSKGSSVALTTVDVPFANPQHTAPDRVRPVVDTSSTLSLALLADVPVPFYNLPYPTPDRVRPVTDTTKGTPKVLYADSVIPFFVTPHTAPDRVRPVVDTSRGTAKVLYADSVIPFQNLQHTAPDRQRAIFSETSVGLSQMQRAITTVWPDPSNVFCGVTYGPNGNDYVGTMCLILELDRGELVKLLTNKTGLRL
jgi:hypothetical protein